MTPRFAPEPTPTPRAAERVVCLFCHEPGWHQSALDCRRALDHALQTFRPSRRVGNGTRASRARGRR